MVLVEVDGSFVVVDPQSGIVTTPVTTLADATPLLTAILTQGYHYDGTSTVTVVQSTTPVGADIPFFTTDPMLVDLFAIAMFYIDPTNDPLLYLGPVPLP